MSRSEMYSAALLSNFVNALKGEKAEPFTIDWPWPDAEAEPPVSADEMAELTARLRASSAIAQMRPPEAVPSTTE